MKITKLIKITMIYSLKMFNTGQVTLPKAWRKKYDTHYFLAKETDKGLLIQPIREDEDVIAYENKKESGLIFPKGMDPQKLIDKISEIDG